MNMRELLIESLDSRWKKYKAELKTCRQNFSEESVHDFRVSIRRLLSLLEMLRSVMEYPKIRKIRRELKDQLDDLDDLRDTQTLLMDISGSIQEMPALQPFQQFLEREEKKLLKAARKDIKSLKITNLAKRVGKLQKNLQAFAQPDFEELIFSAVDEAFMVVMQRYALIDPSQPSTIHRVRIAFKKFRYMLECIHPVLQDMPQDYLKKLHNYQSAMGDIQDMEVALQRIADFSAKPSASFDLEPVLVYYQKRHSLAVLRYLEDKGEVITFWRSAPTESFPEENRK